MNLLHRNDETFMRLALNQAAIARDEGEVPVGAVVVVEGHVIARAFNQVEKLRDATAHAEILAITQASAAIKDWRLSNATLYVTKEPCAMCAGAMVNAKLGTVVFGVTDPRAGAAGSALNVTAFDGHLHKVTVLSGVLHEECLCILQEFFRKRRQDKRDN